MEKASSLQWLIRLANLLLILLCGYVVMKLSPAWRPIVDLFIQVLIPFFIAGLITYLLHPVIEQLHDMGLPRPLAVLLIYFIFFGGIGYLIFRGTPYIVSQLKDFAANIPEFTETFRVWFQFFNERLNTMPEGVHQHVEEWIGGLEEYLDRFVAGIIDVIKQILNSLIYFIVIPFLVFYLLKDFKLVEKTAWYLTPRKWREESIAFIHDVDKSFGRYIRGQILVSLSVGLLAMTGLWLIGMPYPVLLGIFIGMTDIIPYFGAFLGAVPALIVAAMQSMEMLLYTAIVIFVLQQVEGNILSPVIVGKTLHMHPVLIMLALIIGIEIGGIFGLVLAVPTLAIIKVILLHVRANLMKD
ncbi:AI-2E family transporter [Desertibacillus haloalkaliphilus]|uniref:AI-2E family transporter n=1 Tax=Desertibacillus haloalkaliphilus TaxID=1328930 RepID=UPI001C2721C7|nr:AI-2E family transporter [Desertibacillus haloalkaliphilus]MBU8905535.1 AI-2E family transporter [Desertibacillus haloalkaliphilus]